MQPIRQQSIVLREYEVIGQSNEVSDVENDLCSLSGLFEEVKIIVKEEGMNLTALESQVNEVSKVIMGDKARLSESQATQSNMTRLGIYAGTGMAIGITAGVVISCFVPPVAAIVIGFITTVGGLGGGGAMGLSKS